ncbi:MAG: His-Xaa-Ser repeat protein HxsA [Nitrosomonadales bacterium]|nr:His-Xaa-Ser repeat protein HxsA [Nitrosomonadales bacterium]
MRKFIKTLSLFIASVPLVMTRTAAALPSDHGESVEPLPMPNLDPVQLRPLNHGLDNLFAGHRSHSSHSSHASHSSHYSGSAGSGSYSAPQDTSSANSLAPQTDAMPSMGTSSSTSTPHLSTAEKLKLQVMRVQIALISLGIYSGVADGELNDKTKEALKMFQRVKGLPADGLMTTDTLNALGVRAVQ